MKRNLYLFVVLLLALPQLLLAEPIKPVKNVIFMVADGTSLSTLSLARWYQNIEAGELTKLHLDPYISGTILTFCSNAPIGDSAPTTSTYMNGMPSIQGMVGTYPYATEQDLVPVDSTMAYRPILSLMEAAKVMLMKRVGVVMTCEFPHATPADATAHSYSRKRYDWIIPQMVYNNLDVVIGGGTALLGEEYQTYLRGRGYGVYLDDYSSLTQAKEEKIWSLFSERDIPYDMDGVKGKDPKLSEMVSSALNRLSKDNELGFFLLVEGSKIDWAAHANDPVAMATEALAFDQAVKVALDYAKADGNTIVVVTSDHGNSGMSIGRNDLHNYAGASKETLFGPLTKIKKSSVGLAQMIVAAPEDQMATIFEEVATFPPTEEQLKVLSLLRKLELADDTDRPAIKEQLSQLKISGEGALYTDGLSDYIASIYRSKMYLGFTTHGHTAEDVFLASYAPKESQRLYGVHNNIELHNYLKAALGLGEYSMLELSKDYFAPHTQVFAGCEITISVGAPQEKVLTVKKGGNTLTVKSFTNQLYINGKLHELSLPVVYVDKRGEFYLPTSLRSSLD